MKTHTITTYDISDHPEPEKCYEWIRSHWQDLGEFSCQDGIKSLEGFCSHFDLDLKDYSVYPGGNSSVTIPASQWNTDQEDLVGVRLWKYLKKHYMFVGKKPLLEGNCPFTGTCFDEDILDPMRAFIKNPDNSDMEDLVADCVSSLFKALRADYEYIYSDEGIKDFCEANEYEFLKSGEVYWSTP